MEPRHIGFFSLPWLGHIHPMAGLAGQLSSRGHRVTFFHLPEFADLCSRPGCHFEAYGQGLFEAGTFAHLNQQLSLLEGEAAISAALSITGLLSQALLRQAAPILDRADLDLWVVDQLDYAAATLAAQLQAPFVTAAVTLLRNPEEGIPGFNGEELARDARGQQRERHLADRLALLVKPYLDDLNQYRKQAGMEPFSYATIWSQLAQISQQPAQFEFPRTSLPACFHFTGPFVRPQDRPRLAFPWHLLNGRPLVYVSFGTAQQRHQHLFQATIEAVRALDVQLLISLGGATDIRLEHLPESALVLPFVPQLEVLERAAMMVTHAGMNSTLECLRAGVPMVAVPISHDQPGIAARIQWSGTGLRVPQHSLVEAIARVLHEESFRVAARQLQQQIAEARGLERAADIVEQVLQTGRPVLRQGSHGLRLED